jgi:hypothetical protein
MILLNGGVPIAFAGTEAPAAYGELISIGGLGASVNGKLSSTIAEILQTKLSIDSSRFYVKFYDVEVKLFDLFHFICLDIICFDFVVEAFCRKERFDVGVLYNLQLLL